MGRSAFQNVEIKGISTVIPKNEICIYDEAEYYDNNVKKIDRMRKMAGFYKRRVVEKDLTAADLALQGAENLLDDMNIDRSTIDALVFVTQSPDFIKPATAFFIHHKLGLSKTCQVFDVTQGCPGWVYGLWIAGQMIESRACKRVLMLVGDTPSVNINLKDRVNAPVFGDGAAATLLEYSDACIRSWYYFETHSKDYEAIATPFLGARCGFNMSDERELGQYIELLKCRVKTEFGHKASLFSGYMDGLAVFNFTMTVVPENIKEVIHYAGMTERDIAYLCLHQANKQIIQTVGHAAGFPDEKVPYFAFENYGNNTMASIPTTLCSVLPAMPDGQPKTVLCSGFGNGLACASCIITLDDAYISNISEYVKPEDHLTREQYIEYWKQKLKGENNE